MFGIWYSLHRLFCNSSRNENWLTLLILNYQMSRSIVCWNFWYIRQRKRYETRAVSLNLSQSERTKSRNPSNPWAIAQHLHPLFDYRFEVEPAPISTASREDSISGRASPQLPPAISSVDSRGGEEISRSMKRGGCIGGVFTSRHSLLFQANLFIEERRGGGQPSSPPNPRMRAILIFWKTRQVSPSRVFRRDSERIRREPIKYRLAKLERATTPRIICIPPPFFSSSN